MIKVIIDKAQLKGEAEKAAFTIVKAGVEKAMKKLEADVAKEGGTVEVRVTGPGAFDVSMEGLSPKLRKKVASVVKSISK